MAGKHMHKDKRNVPHMWMIFAFLPYNLLSSLLHMTSDLLRVPKRRVHPSALPVYTATVTQSSCPIVWQS